MVHRVWLLIVIWNVVEILLKYVVGVVQILFTLQFQVLYLYLNISFLKIQSAKERALTVKHVFLNISLHRYMRVFSVIFLDIEKKRRVKVS